MTVLYGIVATGVGLAMICAGGVRQLARVIHDGELDQVLAQPKPTLLYVLGRKSGAAGVGDLVSGIAMIALSGAVHLTTARQLFELVITFSVYPEPLFGGVLRMLLFTLVPTRFVGYVPAHVVQAPTLGGAVGMVVVAAVYAAAAAWVFGRGLRKYYGGSRFEVVG